MRDVMPDYAVKHVEIDHEDAVWLLGNNTHNRTLTAKNVKQYQADMQRGIWHPHGDVPYKFGPNLLVLDGQTRLTALSKCGPEVKLNVWLWFECDTDAQAFMDRGSKRNLAMDLSIHKVPANTTLAAAIPPFNYYLKFGRILDSNPPVNYWDTSTILQAYPSIITWAVECKKMSSSKKNEKILDPSVAACLGMLFELATDFDTSRDFIASVLLGTNILEVDDARYRLREKLREKRGDKDPLRKSVVCQYVISAWNKYIADMKVVRLNRPTSFPIISRGSGQGGLTPVRNVLSYSKVSLEG